MKYAHKLLIKKFKSLPSDLSEKIMNCDNLSKLDQIPEIIFDIYDLDDIQDILGFLF